MDKSQGFKDILSLLSQAPSDQVRYELSELLFTPNELEQLVARFEIIKGLVKGDKTQRSLSADLGLSIAKITRGSNELKRRSVMLRSYLGIFFL